MNLADFIISGKFGENYSKILIVYFNTYFDYTTFNINENGISTTIEINVKYGKEIIPLCFEFKKDYFSNTMILEISCMYNNLFENATFSYKNFVDFIQIFENQLLSYEDLQKFYIN